MKVLEPCRKALQSVKRIPQAIKKIAKNITKAIWWTVKKVCNLIYWFVREIVSATIHVSLIVILAVMIPSAYKKLTFINTAQHVYRLTSSAERGHGTGFSVVAPSGQNYILTNSHVCEMGKKPNKMMAQQGGMNRPIARRIMEVSKKTDLCLVEGFPNHGGLELADSVRMREYVAFVGHPLDAPAVMKYGEILGERDVEIVIGPATRRNCRGPRNKIKTIDEGFGPEKLCMEVTPSYMTDIETYPGNSGSPAINIWGNVVGIAFAINTTSYWGYFVPLKDIKEFLAPY